MRHILARRIRQVLLVPGGCLKWTAMGSQGGLLTKHKLAYPVPSPAPGSLAADSAPGSAAHLITGKSRTRDRIGIPSVTGRNLIDEINRGSR